MSKGRLDGKTCLYKPTNEAECNWGGQGLEKYLKKPVLVFVHDHTYTVDGRISNWVTFSLVKKDGTVSAKKFGCYDYDQFKPVEIEMIIRRVK